MERKAFDMSDLHSRSVGTRRVSGLARHGRLRKFGSWGGAIPLVAITLAVILVSGASVASVAVWQIGQNVSKAVVNIHPGEKVAPPPGIGAYPGGFNVLVVGDDTRAGQGGIGAGPDSTGALNDVTMLLHVSGDHTFATAVSFPRDMVVPHPQCSKGGVVAGLPINNALAYGGLPCVVTTIEAFTGLKIQFAGLITFDGVINMSDAVGGVQVCVSGNLNDKEVGLHLTSGYHTLTGGQALEFLRSRHGVGDGSDLGRIASQQVYLSSLVRTLQSQDTLGNPLTVYKLAAAATTSMQLSSSLNSVTTLVAIAQALKAIPPSRVVFVQYPGSTAGTGIYTGKVQPNLALGNQLFSLIRADQPFTIGTQAGNLGSVPDKNPIGSTASPQPTGAGGKKPVVLNNFAGQTADTQTCSKANKSNGEG
jgi:LCP family protein required for cell wall assembly